MKLMKKLKHKKEQRSQKICNILGQMPPSYVKWVTAVVVVIFLALLLIACFVPYPYSKGESILHHLLFS